MTENTNQNPFASFEAFDPVRVLVCEDCCSEIAGCSHSFDEILEWGRAALEFLIICAKYAGMVIFSIQMFCLSLVPRMEIDPEEDAYQRQKRSDLALTVDAQAQLRKDFFYDVRIYDRESLARQYHLEDKLGELRSALGSPGCDPGVIDAEMRKTRNEQIALAEHRWNVMNLVVSDKIRGYVKDLDDLDHDWHLYMNKEQGSGSQSECNYWKDKRLQAESNTHRTQKKLAEARNHFAIVG